MDEPDDGAHGAQGDELVDRRGAQPEAVEQVTGGGLDDVDHRRSDRWMLEVEREVEARAALLEQPTQRRDVLGQVGGPELVDRPASPPDSNDAVMVEHDLAVGRQPDVTLQPGGAELEGALERLDRVLRRPVPGSPMGKSDRGVEQRGQPLLHDC